MKKLVLAAVLGLGAIATGQADVGYVTGVFKGYITAIESERDSFTVMTDPHKPFDNEVKMFQVSASRKSQLQFNDKVTVHYIEAYEWPLKTTSITVHRAYMDK